MKVYFWLPLACLLGLFIGSWGAREEGVQLRREIDRLSRAPKGGTVSGFNTLAQMAHIPSVASGRAVRAKLKKEGSSHAGAMKQTAEQPAAEQKPVAQVRLGMEKSALNASDLQLRIDEAKELWKTRMDIARTQVLAELALEARGKVEAFDDALAEMNEKIYRVVEEIAVSLQNEETMTPELTTKLMAYVGDALADTYDKVAELAPPEKRDFVSQMKIYDFIDPMVAEPLIDVQNKLQVAP